MSLCYVTHKWHFSVRNASITSQYGFKGVCIFLVRGAKPGKNVQLQENEIRGLCLKSREIFLSQPILLELEAPLKICGKSSFIK